MSEHLRPAYETGQAPARWREIVAKYSKPITRRAVFQLLNTVLPYVAIWALIYFSLSISYWLTAGLILLAAGFLVRIFIIFHDCGHGSFFRSKKANAFWGFITGVLTFTPHQHWLWEHAVHHASAGDLDRRGTGDIWTLTVREYLEASRWKRFSYRLARNPIVLFVLAPLVMFLVVQRFPARKAGPRERRSVYLTNLALLIFCGAMSLLFGLEAYLLLQLMIMTIAGAAGIWLFYVQHQFEGVYWERTDQWDFCTAALKGSSFYKLPRVLQWFSGNIGFHHIHHLSPRIPNYNLERCHRAEALFQTVKPITLLASFKSLGFRLWDEQRQRLVGFRAARRIAAQQRCAS